MGEKSIKFPAVMVSQSFLGIEEGTVLRFDWASAKYISIDEQEDIAEDYYYSGHAVALDPYLVKDNIGTYFTYIEQGIEETEQEKEVEITEHVVTKEDVEMNPGEDLTEGEVVGLPFVKNEYEKIHPIVSKCSCGVETKIGEIQSPGVSITMMAEDPNSFIEVKCSGCGVTTRIFVDGTVDLNTANEPVEATDKQ